jgi:DNA-binding winged helix-turn-helix (wHTH) protein/Tol biopolymer transport system component
MSENAPTRLKIGDFDFDCQTAKLLRDGRPVKIQPQPLRVFQLLVERRGEIVSREELHRHIWNGATFVEFDQGLNYCIRQIRLTLGDDALNPTYIETLPKQGYRLIVQASPTAEGDTGLSTKLEIPAAADPIATMPESVSGKNRVWWFVAAAICGGLAFLGVAVYFFVRPHNVSIEYTQLTDFNDSAFAPALSPDGHMLAFIRGCCRFFSPDPVYVKMLPNGEPVGLTDDKRPKCCLSFSSDGSLLAYTVRQFQTFATYTVPVLGGGPHLFVNNAAGLTWLDDRQLLFSQIRGTGLHLGVVTATADRGNLRELYFPPHEREMAHYSLASPDRKFALVVQMNEQGGWSQCRLISMTSNAPARPIGPDGECTAAGWSPDGTSMYFIASATDDSHASPVEWHRHLWQQQFPDGRLQQLTAGTTEENGIAVENSGHALITSVGTPNSAIWIHDAAGERPLTLEGNVMTDPSPPRFSLDGKSLYYLLYSNSAEATPELHRISVSSGRSEPLLPGIAMLSFAIAPDESEVVYSTGQGKESSIWIAPLDRKSPPRRIGHPGDNTPYFDSHAQIIFKTIEGHRNFLERMHRDGTARAKVISDPIIDILGISPGRRWIIVIATAPGATAPLPMAIPTDGGFRQIIAGTFCFPVWSPNGKFLFVPVEEATRTNPGRSLAIPLGPNEGLPPFPAGGIPPDADANIVPGARSVNRYDLIPGNDPSAYAFVKTNLHANLYRISIR